MDDNELVAVRRRVWSTHRTQLTCLNLGNTRPFRYCARLNDELRREGWACAAMHGDMEQWERDQTLEKFRKGLIRTLVATDVASRGLDITDISAVRISSF